MEDNKLIAEFMELPFEGGYYKNDYNVMSYFPQLEYGRKPDQLEFESSWDWLIPVIEKILSEGYILEGCNLIAQIRLHLSSPNLSLTYKAVVEFIKWYNRQK